MEIVQDARGNTKQSMRFDGGVRRFLAFSAFSETNSILRQMRGGAPSWFDGRKGRGDVRSLLVLLVKILWLLR